MSDTPAVSSLVLLPVPRGRDLAVGLAGGIGGMLAGLVIGFLPGVVLRDPRLALLAVPAGGLAGIAGLWLTLVRLANWTMADFGFRRSRRGHVHLAWQIPLLFVANGAFTFAAGHALGLAPDGRAERAQEAMFDAPWWLVVAGLAALIVLLPLVEEVLFRRLILDWFGARMPMLGAGLSVALIFGAVHLVPAAIVYLSGLGACLVLLRLWHGTLWAPLALHATNNLLVSVGIVVAMASG